MLDRIRSFLELGGPVVAILLALSVFAVALILLKLAQFARERVGMHGRSKAALHAWFHDGAGDARAMVEGDRSAVAAALSLAMRLAAQRSVPRAIIEEEIGRVAMIRLHGLQKGFRALDAIAQIAPLLGLFGTVLGMIEAFRQLQGAGAVVDPSILAGGIWVALLTTAVGLAVAMPVSLVLTFLVSRVENERVAIETMTTAVLSQHAIGEARRTGAAQADAFAVAGHAMMERSHAH